MTQPPEDSQPYPPPFSSAPPADSTSPYVPPSPYQPQPPYQAPPPYPTQPQPYPPYQQGPYGQPGPYAQAPYPYVSDPNSTPPRRRSRRTALIASAGVVVVVAVVAIILGTNHKSTGASHGSQTLVDPTDHFQVTVPATWFQVADSGAKQQLESQAAKALPSDQASALANSNFQFKLFAGTHDGGSSSSVNLVVTAEANATDPDVVIDAQDGAAQELKTIGMTVDKKAIVKYAGQTALRLDYHGSLASQNITAGIQVYLVHDLKVYIVTVTTDGSTSGQQALEDVLTSIKFTD